MSIRAIMWALDVSNRADLSRDQTMVLIILAHHHNPTHGCFPSQEVLCKRLRLSERMLRYHLSVLSRKGLVKVRASGRRNRYELNFDWTDTGNPLPVSSENIFTNTGNPLPVLTGNPLPVSGGIPCNTGNPLPVEYKEVIRTLNSNPSNLKVGVLKKHPTPSPEQQDQNHETMKIEDVLAKEMAPKTDAEVLKIYSDAVTKKQTVTGGILGKLWVGLHTNHHIGKFCHTLSKVQQGQLRQMYVLAGDPFVKALPVVIEHWAEFIKYLHEHYGVNFKHDPPLPRISVVQTYLQEAVQFSLDYKDTISSSLPVKWALPSEANLTKKVVLPTMPAFHDEDDEDE